MAARAPSARPPVRLWVMNHPIMGITEQVEFFCSGLRQNGYPVSVSNGPAVHALNVLIENFSPLSTAAVEAFCAAQRKRVAVIMTEHIDFTGGELRFHGIGMDVRNDYMLPVTKMGRLFSLLTLGERIRFFLRLGDLPELKNFDAVLPDVPVRTIPFPRIEPVDRALPGMPALPGHDFVFTGIATQHRAALLARLGVGRRVLTSPTMVSRRRRDAMNASAKLVLNLPQNPKWDWVSTMRVLAALRCRRATVAVGEFRHTAIHPFCVVVPVSGALDGQLDDALAAYNMQFERLFSGYGDFVRSPANAAFPHEEFDLWARLEL